MFVIATTVAVATVVAVVEVTVSLTASLEIFALSEIMRLRSKTLSSESAEKLIMTLLGISPGISEWWTTTTLTMWHS